MFTLIIKKKIYTYPWPVSRQGERPAAFDTRPSSSCFTISI